jgi:hypothetical protein
LKNIKKNISDEKIREILFLNVDRAKDIDILKKKLVTIKITEARKIYTKKPIQIEVKR